MIHLIYAGLGFALLLGKTSLLAPWPALAHVVDPVLLLVVYLGLFRPGPSFALVALFLGYLVDIFSGSHFGFHIIVAAALYYLSGLVRGRVFLESVFFHAVFCAAMIAVSDLLAAGIFRLIIGEKDAAILLSDVVWRVLANSLLAVPLFHYLSRVDERWAPLHRGGTGIALD